MIKQFIGFVLVVAFFIPLFSGESIFVAWDGAQALGFNLFKLALLGVGVFLMMSKTKKQN